MNDQQFTSLVAKGILVFRTLENGRCHCRYSPDGDAGSLIVEEGATFAEVLNSVYVAAVSEGIIAGPLP